MYVPLFADIISAERWLMIMPMAVLSNFLIYCVVNAFTPGPGNILALNTVTNYGYKKGKPLFFGIFAGYYVVQIISQAETASICRNRVTVDFWCITRKAYLCMRTVSHRTWTSLSIQLSCCREYVE